MSCTPSLWRRSPLADTPSLLANGRDILNVGIYSRIIAFRDKCYMNKQVLRILERHRRQPGKPQGREAGARRAERERDLGRGE